MSEERIVRSFEDLDSWKVAWEVRKFARQIVGGLPTSANYRGLEWTWDFIADATQPGGSLRMLTILDEYTRECHVLRADRTLKSADVIAWRKKAMAKHGATEFIRFDNGSEFIAKELQGWLAQDKIKTIYIAKQPMAKRPCGVVPRTFP